MTTIINTKLATDICERLAASLRLLRLICSPEWSKRLPHVKMFESKGYVPHPVAWFGQLLWSAEWSQSSQMPKAPSAFSVEKCTRLKPRRRQTKNPRMCAECGFDIGRHGPCVCEDSHVPTNAIIETHTKGGVTNGSACFRLWALTLKKAVSTYVKSHVLLQKADMLQLHRELHTRWQGSRVCDPWRRRCGQEARLRIWVLVRHAVRIVPSAPIWFHILIISSL